MNKTVRTTFTLLILMVLAVIAGTLARQAVSSLEDRPTVPTPVILEPVTLDSLDIVDSTGQPCGLFLHGDTVTLRYRMDNPNPIPVRTHISATIARRPIVFSGGYVMLTQQQVPVWVQPGSHTLEVSATIPSDALLGRYEARVTHTDSGDTQQLEDVFFIV